MGNLNRVFGGKRTSEERRDGIVNALVFGGWRVLTPEHALVESELRLALHIGESLVGRHRRAPKLAPRDGEHHKR